MSACEICGTPLKGSLGQAEVSGTRQLCPACASKVAVYRERVERRVVRWERRADKAQAEFERRHGTAKEMASWIPFGQPILVGHHSEKRDRAYRAKIERNFRKAFEALGEAEQLRIRARASERNRAISSDDPLAVVALREKIARAQKDQDLMKAVNAAIRKHAKQGAEAQVSALVALGLSERAAKNAIEPDYMGRVGFPSYALTNNWANIRRMQERLKGLEARAKMVQALEAEGTTERVEQWGAIAVIHNYADNRLRIVFPSKPTDVERKYLREEGFHWSPNNKAWQRMLNNASIHSANMVLTYLGYTLTPENGETPEPQEISADEARRYVEEWSLGALVYADEAPRCVGTDASEGEASQSLMDAHKEVLVRKLKAMEATWDAHVRLKPARALDGGFSWLVQVRGNMAWQALGRVKRALGVVYERLLERERDGEKVAVGELRFQDLDVPERLIAQAPSLPAPALEPEPVSVPDLPEPTVQRGLFGEDKRVKTPASKMDTPQQKPLFGLEDVGGSASEPFGEWTRKVEGRLI